MAVGRDGAPRVPGVLAVRHFLCFLRDGRAFRGDGPLVDAREDRVWIRKRLAHVKGHVWIANRDQLSLLAMQHSRGHGL